MQTDTDDRTRPNVAVVVSLLDVGDGQSRVILDDVVSPSFNRETSWKFDQFYTHKTLPSRAIDNMVLSDNEYRDFGIAVFARLLALTGRVK